MHPVVDLCFKPEKLKPSGWSTNCFSIYNSLSWNRKLTNNKSRAHATVNESGGWKPYEYLKSDFFCEIKAAHENYWTL